MWRLFSSSRPSDTPPKPDPSRGLAASWYRSPELNQLEKRAIFQRRWILVTHSLRFAKPGDYISFNIAGLAFFLVTDREGNLHGFHNVCRHRAYPIVEHQSGTARVLSCNYHGWSYSLKGILSKAPRFDTVEGFDKSQHSLLPVNVFVDSAGFVYVNLQAGAPDVKWDEHFEGVHDQGRMKEFDFSKEFTFDHYWEQHLDSNWKGIIENFNECYHCATSHPLIAGVSDLTKYRVEPTQGRMEHVIVNKDQEDGQFKRSIIYFYPATSVSVNNHFMVVQVLLSFGFFSEAPANLYERMLPLTATTSKIEFEVYRHRDATDEQFENMKLFYSTIMEEDKHLCDASQRNLNSGVYINGELHPNKEKGPLHFQQLVREDVIGHRQLEVEQGRKEIWPAVPKLSGEMASDRLTKEELFCSQLEADNCMPKPELAW